MNNPKYHCRLNLWTRVSPSERWIDPFIPPFRKIDIRNEKVTDRFLLWIFPFHIHLQESSFRPEACFSIWWQASLRFFFYYADYRRKRSKGKPIRVVLASAWAMTQWPSGRRSLRARWTALDGRDWAPPSCLDYTKHEGFSHLPLTQGGTDVPGFSSFAVALSALEI